MNYGKLSLEIIQHRRNLHTIPELGFLVYKTSNYIKSVLDSMDCTIDTIVSTGLLAFFDFGCNETVVFRADMDALPIDEENQLSFISTHQGCMHACGHDGHMAILLGFAEIINQYKKDGKKLPHNVLLLFQPAEETIDGALKICGTHIFDKYNVKAIYGLHLWPTLSKGEIASRPGPMMAKSTEISIDFYGNSAHCGQPEEGNDALLAASMFVTHIYSYKDHHIRQRSVLKFGHMESGNVRNAISPYTRLEGTMRTFSEETWEHLTLAMNQLAEEITQATGVNISIDTSKSHPAVINSPQLFHKVKPSLLQLNFVEMKNPVMIAEDFAFFEKETEGIFFFLGTGSNIPLHSSNYNFDEDVLIEGVHLFETLVNVDIS